MEYVKLGNTGISVSKICFGALTMGPLQADFTPEAAGEIMAYAFDMGINFVDTAQYYKCYPHIKEALRRTTKDIVVASKTYAYEREAALKAVDEARSALDRDVIDLFMLHEQESVHTLRGHMPALEALYDLKAKGVIRAVGASMHHIAAVDGAVKLGLDFVHPMLNISGLGIADGTRPQMETAVQKAHDAGLGVYSMKALGGGNLYKKAYDCLKYIFSLPYVDSVAIGMQSKDEIDANLRFLSSGAFNDSDIKRLNEKKRSLHIEEYCVGCGRCVEKCGQNALYIENGRANLTPEKCVLCGYCSAACPDFAIKIV